MFVMIYNTYVYNDIYNTYVYNDYIILLFIMII